MPMPIRRVICNLDVKENTNKVAIERGPIVYCIESVDNDVDSIFNIKAILSDALEISIWIGIYGKIKSFSKGVYKFMLDR